MKKYTPLDAYLILFRPERLITLVLKSAAMEDRQFAEVGVEKSFRRTLFIPKQLDLNLYLKHHQLLDLTYLLEPWEKRRD